METETIAHYAMIFKIALLFGFAVWISIILIYSYAEYKTTHQRQRSHQLRDLWQLLTISIITGLAWGAFIFFLLTFLCK